MTNEQLVSKIQDGIDVAENMLRLWQQNQGLIGKIAIRYSGYEDIEDLKQQGYIGLCDAVKGYRFEEGAKFSSYAAFWIRQSIQRYLEECSGVIRIPVGMQGEILRVQRFCSAFERETGREASRQEICMSLGYSRGRLEQLRKAALLKRLSSLDSPVYGGEDEEITVADTVASTLELEAEIMAKVDSELLQEIIWPMVDELPEKCVKVVQMRYRYGMTLKETGRNVGVSIEAARQWESRALRELRKPSRAKKLRPFLEDVQETAAYRGCGVRAFSRTWESSTERAALRGMMCSSRQRLPFVNQTQDLACDGYGENMRKCGRNS